MSAKVKTNTTTDAAATVARYATPPGVVPESTKASSALTPPGRARKPGDIRFRPALLTVPIVLVSTLAISLNLAAPAEAQALAKKPLKAKLAEATPILANRAVTAVQIAPVQYSVVDGDTVSGIAGRFGLSSGAVLALNGLDSRALIFPGQVLTLTQAPAADPAPPAASGGASSSTYTVQSGDTLSGIAAAHGLETGDVLGANGLNGGSVIYPGQVVLLSAADAMEAAVYVTPVVAVAATTTHTIASGETITAVANTAGVSVQAVLDANGLGWSSIIYPGQVLELPVPPASASAPITRATAGVVTPMSEEMRQNARTIVTVGRSVGVGNVGLAIALAAAAQESGLRNVDYGDRDSLGLFQQRPSAGWGTPEQVTDPVRASLAFFGGATNPNLGVTRGLLDIPGWESMTVTQAAQAVQKSAYPDYYAKWETSARAWLIEIG